jgi:hypothetical protein
MNRLLLLCLGAIVLGLISCTDKDKIPKGVLPKDKMESVLWDMLEAERYRATFIKDSAKIKTETFKLYAEVFAIHQITKDQFIKSYKFYMSRPDIARDMFDSLSAMANRRREDMYKTKPPTTDSTHKAGAQPQTPVQPAQRVVPGQPIFPPQHGKSQPITPQSDSILKQLQLKRVKNDSLLKHRP